MKRIIIITTILSLTLAVSTTHAACEEKTDGEFQVQKCDDSLAVLSHPWTAFASQQGHILFRYRNNIDIEYNNGTITIDTRDVEKRRLIMSSEEHLLPEPSDNCCVLKIDRGKCYYRTTASTYEFSNSESIRLLSELRNGTTMKLLHHKGAEKVISEIHLTRFRGIFDYIINNQD